MFVNVKGEESNGRWGIGAEMSDLVGRVPMSIVADEEEIIFRFEDGYIAKFYHEQDCCESVWVEDVNGDWEDLVGVPLLVADERTEYDSGTYTFYTFRSIKGSVDVRWCGESNGYYSESVDLIMYKEV